MQQSMRCQRTVRIAAISGAERYVKNSAMTEHLSSHPKLRRAVLSVGTNAAEKYIQSSVTRKPASSHATRHELSEICEERCKQRC